jgi:manganese oxidase
MKINRRKFIGKGAALVAGASFFNRAATAAAKAEPPVLPVTRPPLKPPPGQPYTPVITLNGGSLAWETRDGVKEFHLVAEPVRREFAPGMVVNCWGYNGQSPGPTIEAVEGDHVRIYVTNKLPEHTTVHWHGIRVPNGMDGVGGLNQPHIPPGKTFVYEFTLRQNGTFMYHPHSDEMVQLAMGMMGMFIVHPRDSRERRVDRDFCFMIHAWDIDPGNYTTNVATMTNFNTWTFNSRVFPGIDPLVVRKGDLVRIRMGNLSMDNHPIHLHGYRFNVTAVGGDWLPPGMQWSEVTTDVPVGATRVIEFLADEPGDWAIHCHRSHHTMGPMSHTMPTMIGVKQDDLTKKIGALLPNYMYMPMGDKGMADMQDTAAMGMKLPENTLPMMTGEAQFGPVEMGGMFTVVKVRENLAPGDYKDPGWYQHPRGTVAYELDKQTARKRGWS